MARTKHIYSDGKGLKWNSPIGEDGKPLITKVNPKKPTSKPDTVKATKQYR